MIEGVVTFRYKYKPEHGNLKLCLRRTNLEAWSFKAMCSDVRTLKHGHLKLGMSHVYYEP